MNLRISSFLLHLWLSFVSCESEKVIPQPDPTTASTIITKEYLVDHSSTIANFSDTIVQLYVREKYAATTLNANNLENKVVLFIHGNSVPGTVSFDLNKEGYSWMNYLAERGFDVFTVDLTGYGASTRVNPMNDTCNLSRSDQNALDLSNCSAKYPFVLKTLPDEMQEIDQVMDYIRKLRNIQKIHLIGYSLGGVRTLAYTSEHPEKVNKIVTLGTGTFLSFDLKPNSIPAAGVPIAIQTRPEFIDYWNEYTRSENQVESGIQNFVFEELLKTDPLGASWGNGGSRSPTISVFGFTKPALQKVTQAILILNGKHDNLAAPAAGRALWNDVASPQKVQLEIEGASHLALWETQRRFIFRASSEWLQNGMVGGRTQSRGRIDITGNYIW